MALQQDVLELAEEANQTFAVPCIVSCALTTGVSPLEPTGSDGENREFGIGEAGSMEQLLEDSADAPKSCVQLRQLYRQLHSREEEELRMLEQLRAMDCRNA